MPDARSTPERLDDPLERDKLWTAIVEHGSVNKAAKALGLVKPAIYLKARKDEAFAAELLAAEATNLRQLVDECIEIADSTDKDAWGIARLRIETRMRLAGKLIPHIYGDQPSTKVDIHNVVGIVCDEKQRAKLIEQRSRLMLANQTGSNVILPDNE